MAPVVAGVRHLQGQGSSSGWSAGCRRRWSCRAAGVSSRSRCRWTRTFDLRYQPHAENTGEGEREIEEDDLTTAFYENDEIDLGQLMREQFYLALPMKPLCRDDCKGLCPVCGTNLNQGTCDCKRDWEDPRLAALKNAESEADSESDS